MSFQVGNLVLFKYDTLVGEILAVRDDNVSTGAKYLIKWAKSRHAPDWEDGEELVLVDPGKDKELATRVQTKIDEAQSLLEKAFAAWSEARQLANEEASFYYLQDQKLITIDSFGTAAENFGWTSSSLHCM